MGFKCGANAELGDLNGFVDPGCTGMGCTTSAGCKAPKNCLAGKKFVRPCGSAVGMCLDCNVSRGSGEGGRGRGGEAGVSVCLLPGVVGRGMHAPTWGRRMHPL